MAAVTKRKNARDSSLAAKVGEKPEKQGQGKTEKEAGHDWEIECSVFAAVNDVARETAKAERESPAEVEERTEEDKEDAQKEEHAAEFSQRIHKKDSRRNTA